MTPDEMDKAARRAEAALRRSWRATLASISAVWTDAELSALISAGQLDTAMGSFGPAMERLVNEWNRQFVGAGNSTATSIESALGRSSFGEVIVTYDMTNTHAVEAMQANQLRMVREFTEAQRRATREALTDGVTRGLNPREQARNFRASIGLTQRQQQAVNNFRRLLERRSSEALSRRLRDQRFDGTVRRAIREKKPLTNTQVDTMTERYRRRFIKHRSEVIARTEALRSVHQGAQQMYNQAVADGTLDPNSILRQWNTARDERVRSSHSTMHGQERRGFDDPFISGRGNALLYPGDSSAPGAETIQCRCVVGTRIDIEAQQGILSIQAAGL